MRFFGSILLACLISSSISAQKPVASRDFEFGQLEQVAYRDDGNMQINMETGFPIAIYNTEFSISATEPAAMAREYLNANLELLGLSATDVEQLEMYFVREGLAGTTVRMRQYSNGLPVHKAEVAITITPRKTVGFVANNLAYGLLDSGTSPAVDAATARNIVADYIGLVDAPSYEDQKLLIYPGIAGGRLSQRVVIASTAPLGEWEAFVDATTGELLKVENISCYYHDHAAALDPPHNGQIPPAELSFLATGTGNVFDPDPLAVPNATYGQTGYSDNGDANSSQLIAQQSSVSLLDITFSGGQYHLDGPYASIVDTESPFRGLFSQASSTWNFNRTDNAFEAVNVYYHVDASMRYLNEDINVTVMPFQYSGGARFDPSGLNNSDNSHYTGGNGVIAFGDGGVDDAEDSDVIHHELGHALHDWITGGNLSQTNGLSEGCGDYWAVSYNRSLGHWSSSQAPYNWVFRWDGHNQFWGGRNVNTTKVYPNNLVGQVHSDGGIWAAAMMQVWDAIGKTKSDQIFWEGLAMTSSNTNQSAAAQAVFNAATDLGCTDAERLQVHTIFNNRGYSLDPFVALPVDLLSFTGSKEAKMARLDWRTATEVGNERFIIERSTDGRSFSPIGSVAGAGDSDQEKVYSFLDQSPQVGTNTYRLLQLDYDGSIAYSNLISLSFEQLGSWSISPNPVGELLQISATSGDLSANSQVSVTDLQGRVLIEQQALNGLSLDVSSLQTGIYFLHVVEGSKHEVKKFVRR